LFLLFIAADREKPVDPLSHDMKKFDINIITIRQMLSSSKLKARCRAESLEIRRQAE
jgi:hypothetical protein